MNEQNLNQVMKENLDTQYCKLSFEETWEKAQQIKNKERVFNMKKLRPAVAIAAALILSVGVGAEVVRELRRDDISYTYKVDEKVLGEWKAVDFVDKIEDFKSGEKNWKGNLFLRGLGFKEGGTLEYFIQDMGKSMITEEDVDSWSNGYIVNSIDETRSEYEIKEIDGKEYLFYQWKSGDYTYGTLDYVPYYVLERGTPTEATAEEMTEGRVNIDDVTYSFVNDPEVIGQWQAVDFVNKKENFVPGEKAWQDDFWLTGMDFMQGGDVSFILEGNKGPVSTETWSKGYLVNRNELTRSEYELVEKDGKVYMFFEWKSGDYIYGSDVVSYYVLEKME